MCHNRVVVRPLELSIQGCFRVCICMWVCNLLDHKGIFLATRTNGQRVTRIHREGLLEVVVGMEVGVPDATSIRSKNCDRTLGTQESSNDNGGMPGWRICWVEGKVGGG